MIVFQFFNLRNLQKKNLSLYSKVNVKVHKTDCVCNNSQPPTTSPPSRAFSSSPTTFSMSSSRLRGREHLEGMGAQGMRKKQKTIDPNLTLFNVYQVVPIIFQFLSLKELTRLARSSKDWLILRQLKLNINQILSFVEYWKEMYEQTNPHDTLFRLNYCYVVNTAIEVRFNCVNKYVFTNISYHRVIGLGPILSKTLKENLKNLRECMVAKTLLWLMRIFTQKED